MCALNGLRERVTAISDSLRPDRTVPLTLTYVEQAQHGHRAVMTRHHSVTQSICDTIEKGHPEKTTGRAVRR